MSFAEKIKAGLEAKTNENFMIIARIESLIVDAGINDALHRAQIYIEAGADGIMIHILPEIENLKKLGKWKGHCNYYYSQEFFEMLATNCDYKILSMWIIDQNICVALQKQGDRNFMIDKDLFLSKIYNIHLHN